MATKTSHIAAQKQAGITLLKKDHEKVRGQLSELEESTERAAKTRTKLLSDIAREITIHAQIEAEMWRFEHSCG